MTDSKDAHDKKSCVQKRVYASMSDARKSAKRVRQSIKGNARLRPYRCPSCSGVHLTKDFRMENEQRRLDLIARNLEEA